MHVDGFFLALRKALATLSGRKLSKLRRQRLTRGLTALIAVDGPAQRLVFQGPTKTLLAIPGLDKAVAWHLKPLLEQALRGHPVVPHLLAFDQGRREEGRLPLATFPGCFRSLI